jgi:hypothetical protein
MLTIILLFIIVLIIFFSSLNIIDIEPLYNVVDITVECLN